MNRTSSGLQDGGPAGRVPVARLVAVIELGTTSLRMAIARIEPSGEFHALEHLQQAVALGKDTFTAGVIGRPTTEQCVEVLRNFRRKLQEYRISDDRDIMAVATSATREATNRDTFVDRIHIATGINVRILDEAEVNRFTYLAVHPLFRGERSLRNREAVVTEVGGGSTEVLLFRKGQVVGSHTYRLGSLRLRQMLEDERAPNVRLARVMRDHIDREIEQMAHALPRKSMAVLALGGDARFAVARLAPERPLTPVTRLKIEAVARLANAILLTPTDDLVRKYHLSYPDAETLGPALMVYAGLAWRHSPPFLLVGQPSLRDGVLSEMAARGSWTQDFERQVVNSAMEIGTRYDFDREHAEQVAELSKGLFESLWEEHLLDTRQELILTVAALLHEVGRFVSSRSHHKHSLYLIQNSDVFGLGPRDLLLAGLVARYHRKAEPKSTHQEYMILERTDRVSVAKMAAILRVADALACRPGQRRGFHFVVEPGTLTITVDEGADLALEQHRLRQKAGMFEQVYGMRVVLCRRKEGESDGRPKSGVH